MPNSSLTSYPAPPTYHGEPGPSPTWIWHQSLTRLPKGTNSPALSTLYCNPAIVDIPCWNHAFSQHGSPSVASDTMSDAPSRRPPRSWICPPSYILPGASTIYPDSSVWYLPNYPRSATWLTTNVSSHPLRSLLLADSSPRTLPLMTLTRSLLPAAPVDHVLPTLNSDPALRASGLWPLAYALTLNSPPLCAETYYRTWTPRAGVSILIAPPTTSLAHASEFGPE